VNASPAAKRKTPVVLAAATQKTVDLGKKYYTSRDRFRFVSEEARDAYNGDGRAAYYISKALDACLPTVSEYRKSANPEADFQAKWSARGDLPQWLVDRISGNFNSCRGFLSGDAFADLPVRPEGYSSATYWMDQAYADGDPVAEALHAGSALSKVMTDRSNTLNTESLSVVQSDIGNAVASGDPAALFQVGLLLSDGHFSSDPTQGFALSLAACDTGYDCSADNPANPMFNGCKAAGTCPSITDYADLVTQAIGPDGYAKAYARAQELENDLDRGDTDGVQNFLKVKSGP
jgi:hypothetical protein